MVFAIAKTNQNLEIFKDYSDKITILCCRNVQDKEVKNSSITFAQNAITYTTTFYQLRITRLR